MTNILITGSRTWKNKMLLHKILSQEVSPEDAVIDGGAPGVDTLAMKWCKNKGIKHITIRPLNPSRREYYLHRNAEMIGMADRVIALWCDSSRGTQFTIKYALKRFKPVIVFNEDGDIVNNDNI